MITETALAIADDKAATGDDDALMLLAERWARRADRWWGPSGYMTTLATVCCDLAQVFGDRALAVRHRRDGKIKRALVCERMSEIAAKRAARRRKR